MTEDPVVGGMAASDCLPYVRACLSEYRRLLRPEDVDDLVAEGCLGLIYAARRWDPSRGLQFRTYAQHWVRGRIQDARRRHWKARRDLPLDVYLVDGMRRVPAVAERRLIVAEAIRARLAARRAKTQKPCAICGGVVIRHRKHSDAQWRRAETCGRSCGSTLHQRRRRGEAPAARSERG